MNKESPRESLKSRLFVAVPVSLTLVFSFSMATKPARDWLKSMILGNERTVLATANGDLTGHGDHITAVKVQTADDLSVEIYSVDQRTQETNLRTRIVLPERRDGAFRFQGQMQRLVLLDLDHDGTLEILAPTFDENLIPRLHIYRYDSLAQIFIKSEPSDQLEDKIPKSQ